MGSPEVLPELDVPQANGYQPCGTKMASLAMIVPFPVIPFL